MEIQGDYLPGKDLGRFIMIGPIPMGTISDGSLSRWLRDVAMYWPYTQVQMKRFLGRIKPTLRCNGFIIGTLGFVAASSTFY